MQALHYCVTDMMIPSEKSLLNSQAWPYPFCPALTGPYFLPQGDSDVTLLLPSMIVIIMLDGKPKF